MSPLRGAPATTLGGEVFHPLTALGYARRHCQDRYRTC